MDAILEGNEEAPGGLDGMDMNNGIGMAAVPAAGDGVGGVIAGGVGDGNGRLAGVLGVDDGHFAITEEIQRKLCPTHPTRLPPHPSASTFRPLEIAAAQRRASARSGQAVQTTVQNEDLLSIKMTTAYDVPLDSIIRIHFRHPNSPNVTQKKVFEVRETRGRGGETVVLVIKEMIVKQVPAQGGGVEDEYATNPGGLSVGLKLFPTWKHKHQEEILYEFTKNDYATETEILPEEEYAEVTIVQIEMLVEFVWYSYDCSARFESVSYASIYTIMKGAYMAKMDRGDYYNLIALVGGQTWELLNKLKQNGFEVTSVTAKNVLVSGVHQDGTFSIDYPLEIRLSSLAYVSAPKAMAPAVQLTDGLTLISKISQIMVGARNALKAGGTHNNSEHRFLHVMETAASLDLGVYPTSFLVGGFMYQSCIAVRDGILKHIVPQEMAETTLHNTIISGSADEALRHNVEATRIYQADIYGGGVAGGLETMGDLADEFEKVIKSFVSTPAGMWETIT